ncbi:uncharacterized protein [Argopecten irradians]|uniref:uncharacterized protein n=1 Tax=Argopecten irradians TaxID=31199 RepID=UPI00371FE98A
MVGQKNDKNKTSGFDNSHGNYFDDTGQVKTTVCGKLRCTICYGDNGKVTVKDIYWRSPDFPIVGTYIEVCALTEGKNGKPKKSKTVKKERDGERKYDENLQVRCAENSLGKSKLVISVWRDKKRIFDTRKPFERICLNLHNMEKGKEYTECFQLNHCTRTDVYKDDPESIDLQKNDEQKEDPDVTGSGTREDDNKTAHQKKNEEKKDTSESSGLGTQFNTTRYQKNNGGLAPI